MVVVKQAQGRSPLDI